MFRQVTDTLYVSPQIGVAEVAYAKALGVTMVVNNRPEGEEPGQTTGAEIEAAAKDAGLSYVAVPVTHAGFSPWQLEQMAAALEQAETGPNPGKVLAYCRSGTRSTLLWALTRARAGDDADALSAQAAAAGYDLSPIRQIMDAVKGG